MKTSDTMPKVRPKGPLCVVEAQHRAEAIKRCIEVYDATPLVGLRTLVRNAVIEKQDQNGEITVEVPKLRELLAAATIMRCLMPTRLRGAEVKAMRKAMKMTL